MYAKLLGVVAVITFVGYGVYSYNSAIEDITILKRSNEELHQTLENNKKRFEEAEKIAKTKLQMVEAQLKSDSEVERVKTEKVYIIRKVKDETGCSATRAPDSILRVFNYREDSSENGDS